MKAQINFLIMLILVVGCSSSFAQNNDVSIQEVRSTLEDKQSNIGNVYEQLDSIISSNNRANKPVKEILLLCVLYYERNGTDAAMDLAYKLKQLNTVEYKAAIKELSTSENKVERKRAKVIEEFVRKTEYDIKHGNG